MRPAQARVALAAAAAGSALWATQGLRGLSLYTAGGGPGVEGERPALRLSEPPPPEPREPAAAEGAPPLCSGSAEHARGQWRQRAQSRTAFQRVVAASAIPPGGTDVGGRSTGGRCKRCEPTPSAWGFLRDAPCRRLDAADAAAALASRLDELAFLGDSVAEQLFNGAVWARAAAAGASGGAESMEVAIHEWYCIPSAPSSIAKSWELSGLVQPGSPRRHRRALVISFGNWYNYDRRPLAWDCRCTPLSSGCDDVREAEAGHEQLNASASSPFHTCLDRAEFNRDMNQCSYSRDLSRLARWMELHRGSLPGHVLWLDSTPQHGDEYAARNGNGTWRNTLAHQVLSAFAPSVGLVRLQPVLDDRWDSHCSTATAKDGLHWCYESDAFEEYLSTVLTAVVAAVDAAAPPVP